MALIRGNAEGIGSSQWCVEGGQEAAAQPDTGEAQAHEDGPAVEPNPGRVSHPGKEG